MRSLALVALVCWPACFLKSSVDPASQISCKGPRDCPSGFTCREGIGRCVSSAGADSTAPTLNGADVLTPSIAKSGDTLELRFFVSEALNAPAEVRLDSGEAFTLDAEASAENAFVYHYVVTGSEAEQQHDIDISLTDIFGNTVSGLGSSRVTFDFTPPALSELDWRLDAGKTAAHGGDVLAFSGQVEFGTVIDSASLLDQNGASLGAIDGVRVIGAGAQGEVDLSTFTLSGTTQLQVELRMRDQAGNLSVAESSRTDTLPLDDTPPTNVTATIVGKPSTITPTVALALTGADASQVLISGDVLDDANTLDWVAFATSITINLSPGNGLKVVHVKARDTAFNETTDVSDQITLAVGPPLSQPTLTLPTTQTRLKNGDLVSVAGTASLGTTLVSARLVDTTTQATAQTLAGIALDSSGVLSGAFIASGLAHAQTVALEVIVRSASAELSVANASRSAPVTIDTQAPTGAQITTNAVVATRSLTLGLAAAGAVEVFIDGELSDGALVRSWVPYAVSAPVQLVDADGSHPITARFRDEAHNEVNAFAVVVLDRTLPTIAQTLSSPWSVSTRAKNNDTLTLTGVVSSGVTLTSAALVSIDASAQVMTGVGCTQNIIGQVNLAGVNLSGTINAGVACPGAVAWRTQVLVQNAAGQSSLLADSGSNDVIIDNTAPSPATASYDTPSNARPGYVRAAAQTLHLAATEADLGPVEMWIEGDVVATARTSTWVSFASDEAITLSPGEGAKQVRVRFRDLVQNVVNAPNLNLTLDLVDPPAPSLSGLRLIETATTPMAPASITARTQTLEAIAGAFAGGADRAEVFNDSACSSRLDLNAPGSSDDFVDVAGDGSFTNTALPVDPDRTYYVVARDPSGRVSPCTTSVRPPRCTVASTVPNPARQGLQPGPDPNTTADDVPAVITLSCDLGLSAAPDVRVGIDDVGHIATFASGAFTSAGSTLTYNLAPDGDEPQGIDLAVIRIRAEAANQASGNRGTDGATTSLDFTPPLLAAGNVIVTENAPPTLDSIGGLANAVTDNAGAQALSLTAYPVKIDILNENQSVQLHSFTVATDGSFVSQQIGNNANDQVSVRLTDAAGNRVIAGTFINDRTRPVLTNLVVPVAQHSGANLVISFDLQDLPAGKPHDLTADPTVLIGSRSAIKQSGTLTLSDGLVHHFVYALAVLVSDPEVSQPVAISASDTAGNADSWSAVTRFDHTPPTSSNSSPGAQGTWNGTPGVAGVAADSGSGVATVFVSLQSLSQDGGLYWDGSSFSQVAEMWLPATGTSSWLLDISSVSFVEAATYRVRQYATDNAGNAETPAAGHTFAYSSTVLPAPQSLVATSRGEARIDLTWAPPATGPAPATYRIYYKATTESGPIDPPFLGSGAAQGPSPISVPAATTSLSVTELPRGYYGFTVTAVDGSGNESALSNFGRAPSRWWRWVKPSSTFSGHGAKAIVSPQTGVFVIVGGGGVVRRSINGGDSWAEIDTPTSARLTGVVANGATLTAAGNGAIVQSLDGGENWSAITGVCNPGLTGDTLVARSGSTVIVARQYSSQYARSTDGGACFGPEQFFSGSFEAIVTNGSRWLVAQGSGISLSTDDGQTFNNIVGTNPGKHAIAMGGTTVIAVGDSGEIQRSTDSGDSFGPVVSGTATALYYLWTNGAGVWLAAGAGVLLRSTDDGVTFSSVASPPCFYTNVLVGQGDDLITVCSPIFTGSGEISRLAYSNNAGQTFTTLDFSPGRGMSMQIGAIDGNDLVIAGDSSGLALVHSPDLGHSVEVKGQGGTVPWDRVVGSGPDWTMGNFVSFYARLESTHDGGSTFSERLLPSNWFVTGLGVANGVIVASAASGLSGFDLDLRIERSPDLGLSWATQAPGYFGHFNDLYVEGPHWFIAGRKSSTGLIRHSADNGQTWDDTLPGIPELSTVAGAGSTFIALEYSGKIVRTNDAGTIWSPMVTIGGGSSSMQTMWGNGTDFIAPDYNGGSHVIRHSHDGGVVWSATPYTTSQSKTPVWGYGQHVYVSGDPVQHSSNGGQNFAPVPTLENGARVHGTANFLVACNKGLATSLDEGVTWTPSTHVIHRYAGTCRALYVQPDGTAMVVGDNEMAVELGPR